MPGPLDNIFNCIVLVLVLMVFGQNAKKHLSDRLHKVDNKLDLQKDLLKGVQDNVRIWY